MKMSHCYWQKWGQCPIDKILFPITDYLLSGGKDTTRSVLPPVHNNEPHQFEQNVSALLSLL